MKMKDTQFETYIEKEACVLALYKLEQLKKKGWDININYNQNGYRVSGRWSDDIFLTEGKSNSDLSDALKNFLEKVKNL